MFIYSVRASTIRFFGVIVLMLSLLVGILVFGNSNVSVSASSDSIKFAGIKTNEDRVGFITQFGISINEEPSETVEFSVPEDFDRIIAGYNEIQKMQGLDLSKYKNKKVTRYTYTAKSYPDYSGEVRVNLIVYRNTIIACDVSSASPDGFVKPLVELG